MFWRTKRKTPSYKKNTIKNRKSLPKPNNLTDCPYDPEFATINRKGSSARVNETWKICYLINDIPTDIMYLTPKNVFIKSIELPQIPQFVVSINHIPTIVKIKIEDKYVSCILNINGIYYVIMRLFGKTLNTGIFARPEKNRAFYKLNNLSFHPTNSKIYIKKNTYEILNEVKILSSKRIPTINILPGYFENINSTHELFYLLKDFRISQVIKNEIKYEIIDEAV